MSSIFNMPEAGAPAVAETQAPSFFESILMELVNLLFAGVVLRMLIDVGLVSKVLGWLGLRRPYEFSKGNQAPGKGLTFLGLGEARQPKGGAKAPQQQPAQLFKSAARGGPEAAESCSGEALKALQDGLQDCVARDDLAGAAALDRAARDSGLKYTAVAYELLLRMYCKVNDGRGLAVFDEMYAAGLHLSFHQLTNLLARCGESHNLALAQRLHGYLREQSLAGLIVFKTLTKVYASCGRFDLACDIYDEVLEAGLEPDAQMYGCLLRFAVQCGRTELSKTLYQRAGKRDKGGKLWLIRSAGKEGKVGEALRLLSEMQAECSEADCAPAYVYTIEALVQNGAMDEAQKLLSQMKAAEVQVGVATFGSMIKGYCNKGQLGRARRVISEMETAGHKPDTVCFNLLISAAVSKNDLTSAWSFADEMTSKGVKIDNYTVCILLKVARTNKNEPNRYGSSHATRALQMLDSVMPRITEDEVLFNTALDICTYRKDHRRLASLLRALDDSSFQPAVHTYGLLIKTCSILGRKSRCWDLWHEMVDKRAMTPNDLAVSCMLDYLASNGYANQALQLWEQYKAKVPANTIIYSTLMKGFANAGNVEASLALIAEMKELGLEMNTVTYTILIDTYARAKTMDQALEVLDRMQQDRCVPNKITYCALIKGFCNVDDMEQAHGVFRRMQALGIDVDTVVINTILEGCVRSGSFHIADLVLADMAKRGLQSASSTLSLTVKMWGKRRNLDAAYAVVSAAFKDGFDVDATVCVSLLNACMQNHAYELAIETLQKTKSWLKPGGPSEDCYGVLISGLARDGRDRCLQAVGFCQEALALSRPPGPRRDMSAPFPDACTTLLRELSRHGLTAELTPLKKKLLDAHLVRSTAL